MVRPCRGRALLFFRHVPENIPDGFEHCCQLRAVDDQTVAFVYGRDDKEFVVGDVGGGDVVEHRLREVAYAAEVFFVSSHVFETAGAAVSNANVVGPDLALDPFVDVPGEVFFTKNVDESLERANCEVFSVFDMEKLLVDVANACLLYTSDAADE